MERFRELVKQLKSIIRQFEGFTKKRNNEKLLSFLFIVKDHCNELANLAKRYSDILVKTYM